GLWPGTAGESGPGGTEDANALAKPTSWPVNVPTKIRPSRIDGAVTVRPGSGKEATCAPESASTAASAGLSDRAYQTVPPEIVGEPFSETVPSACDQATFAEQSAAISTRTRCAPVTTKTARRAGS